MIDLLCRRKSLYCNLLSICVLWGVLVFCAVAQASLCNKNDESCPHLFEIFLHETCPQHKLESLCTRLRQTVHPDDVVIVHKNAKSSETTLYSPSSYPCIMMNRRLGIAAPFAADLAACLIADSQPSDTDGNTWQLQLYLDTTSLQNGDTEVDISVCNLEKHRSFSGNYAIWLVEQLRMHQDGAACWTVRQVIAQGDIFKLPQDATQGCPLPDHFPLPAKQDMGVYALVGAVFDTHGAVQAVTLEELSAKALSAQ